MANKALATITQNSEEFPKECYKQDDTVSRNESKLVLKKELHHTSQYETKK